MTRQWYYADRDRNQQGPVTPEALAQLFRSGTLGGDALVWHDGLPDWQPLSGFADELGLRDLESSPYAPPTATVAAPEEVIVSGGEVVYAGFWKRFAAYFIDSLIAGFAGGIIGALLGVLFLPALMSGGTDASSATMIGFQLLTNLVGAAIGVLYFAGFHSSSMMATPGKLAIGIKVVRSNGEPISFLRGAARYFGLILSSLTLGIGFIMAGFTDRKRALHDMACDTLVVDKWAFTTHPEWQRRELGAVTIIVLVLLAILLVVMALALGAMIWAGVSAAGS